MSIKRILVSWVGSTDLRLQDSPDESGPIQSVLQAEEFDELFLLHNYPQSEVKSLIEHIKSFYAGDVNARHIKLKDPTHFGDIYAAMDNVLQAIKADIKNNQITIQITSGTSSMTAVSILLGKAKYGTRFIQSSREQGVTEPDIPFEIAAEFLPKERTVPTAQISKLFSGDSPEVAAFSDIITQSPEMEMIKAKAAIIAKRNVPVLILGETGTGKELSAKAIHNSSKRKDKPMLVLNCGAIPSELIDTTLFGHVKGAFTGATTSKKGYFEQADGGTLFLDEFGELPLDSQIRLLRVLQQGTFSPVGSTEELKTDVRIIAATNKDLIEEIANNRFREDLFYRVAIGIIHLPPLSKRTGDLPYLAKALLNRINKEVKEDVSYKDKKLSASAINFIKKQVWPGNVRELHSTLLRATLWQTDTVLTESDIADALISSPRKKSDIMARDVSQGVDIKDLMSVLAKHYIEQALTHCHGNKTEAAELLGFKSYQTLSNWMDKYGVK